MKYLLSDKELDNIGYPILPIGDRTGYKRVVKAQAKKIRDWLCNYTITTGGGYIQDLFIPMNEWQEFCKEIDNG